MCSGSAVGTCRLEKTFAELQEACCRANVAALPSMIEVVAIVLRRFSTPVAGKVPFHNAILATAVSVLLIKYVRLAARLSSAAAAAHVSAALPSVGARAR